MFKTNGAFHRVGKFFNGKFLQTLFPFFKYFFGVPHLATFIFVIFVYLCNSQHRLHPSSIRCRGLHYFFSVFCKVVFFFTFNFQVLFALTFCQVKYLNSTFATVICYASRLVFLVFNYKLVRWAIFLQSIFSLFKKVVIVGGSHMN